ncbi:IS701 family transposase [Streptomyces sp. NPDC100445]|uniref:IS701 family transposase n=1 Tax=Streptomyces sp. NPDC100445 TaxID=3366102 RepID=UPI003805B133
MTPLHGPAPGMFTECGETHRLQPFVETVFDCLPRVDQRKWAELYIRALLRTPGKKSVRRLAHSVSDSPTAPQAMHQFVNASPWDWSAARRGLLRWVRQTSPAVRAWTLAPAFIPKRGEHSAGVHRRFDPRLRRVTNCQLGMVVLATGDHGPLPVDWNLYIPHDWAADTALRSKVRVPDEVRGPLWSQAVEVLHRATSGTAGRPAPVTAELSWLPEREAFLAHLVRGEQPFVVEVPGTVRVRPVTSQPAVPSAPAPVRQVIEERGAADGAERQHVVSLPVALPGPAVGRVRLRLLAQRGPSGSARTWLTNLVDRPLPDLLPLMGQPRLAATVVNTLSGDFGLRDFEGRSFPGWHHHTTLVSAAFAYARVRGAAR